MKPTLKAWPHKLPLGVRAMYEVWLGDEKIGVVSHQKISARRRVSRWDRRLGRSVEYSMRVRPLVWRARGYWAPGPFDYRSRREATEALVEAHTAAAARRSPTKER